MELLEACNGGVSQIGLQPCDGLDNKNLIGKIVCYNNTKGVPSVEPSAHLL